MLSKTSLFLIVIGNSLELRAIWKKLKFDWSIIEGGFQLIPAASNWIEVKFDMEEDRERVWEGRPYHISHQLILLKPWRVDFDPATEPLFILDTWVRFPSLPSKFVSNELLRSIMEANNLGLVLKVDAINEKGAKRRYPRVCINIDITKFTAKHIFVVDENGKLLKFPIWFDDFSEGCGSCGEKDHNFKACPKRAHNLPVVINGPIGDGEAGPSAEGKGGEWVTVASKKKASTLPMKVGHSKTDILKLFGINMSIQSDSSSSGLSSASSGLGSRVEVQFPTEMVPVPTPAVAPAVVDSDGMLDEGAFALLSPLPEPSMDELTDWVGDEVIADMDVIPEGEEVQLLDYGEEPKEDNFAKILGVLSEDKIEDIFQAVPTNEEYTIPDLTDPIIFANHILNPVVEAADPMISRNKVKEIEKDVSSNSGSIKRKSDAPMLDTASSQMKGSGVKKLRHDP